MLQWKGNVVGKAVCAVLLALLMIPAGAFSDTNLDVVVEENGILNDSTWMYTGYTYGGITFAIPKESYSYELSSAHRNAGIIFAVGNDDYSL